MKRYRNKAFKFNQDLDRAYRWLFEPVNPVDCAICGDNSIDDLGIYPHDRNENEWRILCDRYHARRHKREQNYEQVDHVY